MSIPTHCPECKTKLKFTKTGTDLYCPNENCSGRHGKNIAAFFAKLRVDDVAQETVNDLIAAGFDTVPKIIKNATPQRLIKLEGYQKTKAEKISKAVQNCLKDVPLSQLMYASGIFQDEMTSLGSTRLNDIVKHLGEGVVARGSANDIRTRLVGLSGTGPRLVALFVDSLPEWRKFFTEISSMYSPPIIKTKGKDIHACFTGFRDNLMEEFIVKNGGTILGSVSKKCTVLFAASNSSGKAMKADKLGVEIVDQDGAWTWLKTRIGK
jgi:DNA ligase (NAD+)